MNHIKPENNTFNIHFMHSLLNEKEKKWYYVYNILNSSQISVLKLSLNTPGFPKTSKFTVQVLSLGCKIIREMFFYSIENIIYFSSFSGDSVIFFIDESPYYLKKFFYSFETQWRIFDTDIYYQGNSINTNDIGEHQKTCFLCKKPYNICIRNPHNSEDIKNYFYSKSFEFLKIFS